MVINLVEKILNNLKNNNFTPVHAIKQHWLGGKYSYKNTPRPRYAIMLIIQGRIDFEDGDNTLKAKPGDVVFLPKGSHYEAVFRAELGEIYDYLVSFESDNDFCVGLSPVTLFKNASPDIADAFEKYVKENYDTESNSLKNRGMLYLLLDTIINQNKENKNIIDNVKDLLNKNDNIKISEIAKICHISESGLRKSFKDSVGISPTEYRINAKINKAKYLLESTAMSIKEIADELSFFDEAYFCHIFKKRVGITPKQYLKNKKL
jgi:AraC-like DNA-binding protein